MDNTKNDQYYAKRIREDLAFIVRNMKDVDMETLAKHEILQDSMLFRLIQISENAKKLSEKYKAEKAFIPWTAVYGLRNRIVHDYYHCFDNEYSRLKRSFLFYNCYQ